MLIAGRVPAVVTAVIALSRDGLGQAAAPTTALLFTHGEVENHLQTHRRTAILSALHRLACR